MKKQVMTQAWAIARKAAVELGGRAVEFFAQALREAWKLAKTVVPAMMGAAMVQIQDEQTQSNAKFDSKSVAAYIEKIKALSLEFKSKKIDAVSEAQEKYAKDIVSSFFHDFARAIQDSEIPARNQATNKQGECDEDEFADVFINGSIGVLVRASYMELYLNEYLEIPFAVAKMSNARLIIDTLKSAPMNAVTAQKLTKNNVLQINSKRPKFIYDDDGDLLRVE
jgi:hypothetical protein